MKKRFTPEEIRLQENHIGTLSIWDKWGPYVAERAWGTVREDYSINGDAWNFTTHDIARSKAFRWGEDGIAAISDRYQTLVLSLALWNHKDPILKERLFGLNPYEGNHGEDVKEAYFYLDNAPTHSYMKYLYKYPAREFPYKELIEENQKRTKQEPEYEIYDTDAFKENRYFDVFVEYAKVEPEEIICKIEVINRSSSEEVIDILPQATFRNTWSHLGEQGKKPILFKGEASTEALLIELDDRDSTVFPMLDVDYKIGKRYLFASPGASLLFTENETNYERLGGGKNASPYTKDAFHREVIQKEKATNPKGVGTKACFHYKDIRLPPGGSKVIYLHLSEVRLAEPLANIEAFCKERKKECEEFYDLITPEKMGEEEKRLYKSVLSSQLWSRQLYLYAVNSWIKGDPACPLTRSLQTARNEHWKHLVSKHVITMPDKWEYPWFASWDLAFHSISIALYDMELAKDQLWLLLTEQFQHPNGQIPAYEWEFSDLNPPVQAFALLKLYQMEQEKKGRGDRDFLEKAFQKLVVNFVWWVNREDKQGNNVFEGGFLGLDNIAVIDRSKPIPGGGTLEQSDGTGWMGMFCLNLMRIAIELSKDNPIYEVMVTKFFQHFLYISTALMNSPSRDVQNWNEEDGFFYDVLSLPSGAHKQIPVRSLVGIIPLFATDFFTDEELRKIEGFFPHFEWFLENKQELIKHSVTRIDLPGKKGYLFSLAAPAQMRRILSRAFDSGEFRSPYGLRSLSKYHEKNPYRLFDSEIHYAPGESQINMYGGNSNWRGPIWFPTNYLFIETLKKLESVYGEAFSIPSEGKEVSLKEMRAYYAKALVNLFSLKEGERAIFHGNPLFKDPHFKDLILFYEYFHGETGQGLGASHQTGWTALIANILHDLYTEET